MPPKKNTQSEGPQKFLKTGKVVIILQGRHAGKKAIIVKGFDEKANAGRPYSHAIVAGIEKYPRKVSRKMNLKQLERRSKLKPFLKVVNYSHLMPTRYGVDIDLKNVVNTKTVADPTQRAAAKKEIGQAFQKRYLSGKNKWFFSPLRF